VSIPHCTEGENEMMKEDIIMLKRVMGQREKEAWIKQRWRETVELRWITQRNLLMA
jgi:hypothetical protein